MLQCFLLFRLLDYTFGTNTTTCLACVEEEEAKRSVIAIDVISKVQLSYLSLFIQYTMAEGEVKHLRVTYNDIHNLIRRRTPDIAEKFNPDLLIAIGASTAFLVEGAGG